MAQPVPASEVHRWWWHPITAAGLLVAATFAVAATTLATDRQGTFLMLDWLMLGATAGFVTSGST